MKIDWKDPKQVKARRREYYLAHRDKEIAAAKAYNSLHSEEVKLYNTAYKIANRVELSEYNTEYHRTYQRVRRVDPTARLVDALRGRLYKALKGIVKETRTFELVGCTDLELCVHLETQFRPGMTWENYGPVWHVDHIKPCASFNLTDPTQQRACFNYKNLQPLFAMENFKKGCR